MKDYLKILRDQGKYKIGIEAGYYEKTLKRAGLEPGYYGPILFENYGDDKYLMVKENIISMRTLRNELVQAGAMGADEHLPQVIEKIYGQSVPKFKTQSHFYGYDGRGTDPTMFDCNYGYNLGLTVFSLIAGGATDKWLPYGTLSMDSTIGNRWGFPLHR